MKTEAIQGLLEPLRQIDLSNYSTTALVAGALGLITAAGISTWYLTYPDIKGIPGKNREEIFSMIKALQKGEAVQFHQRHWEEFGEFCKIASMHKCNVLVTNKDVIASIVKDSTTFPRPTELMEPAYLLCKALFLLEGPEWKSHRHSMITAFTQKTLKHVLMMANETMHKTGAIWDKKPEFEVRSMMTCIVTDVLGLSLFSADFKYVDGKGESTLASVEELSKSLQFLFFLPKLLWPIPLWIGSFKKHRKAIYDEVLGVIEQKRQKMSEGKQRDGYDMIDALMANTSLTPDDMVGEMIGLFLAGQGTSSSTLLKTTRYLLEYPEVLSKAKQEIEAVLGDSDPTMETLPKLVYIDGIIRETLRLCPVGDLVGRAPIRDIEIRGVSYPKGTLFLLGISGMQTDERYFPDGKAFKPERWLNASEWLQPDSYMPFLDGPHRCIGEKFALIVMKAVLIHFVRDWDFVETPLLEHEKESRILDIRFPKTKIRVSRRS